jgi:transcriptional regulator with XRE-family HTH domain
LTAVRSNHSLAPGFVGVLVVDGYLRKLYIGASEMSTEKIVSSDNFGHRLKIARRCIDITQGKFAENLSITGSYISDIEKGKAIPSEAVIREIVAVHRINRIWLETGEGQMFTSAGYGTFPPSETLHSAGDIDEPDGLAWSALRPEVRRRLDKIVKYDGDIPEEVLVELDHALNNLAQKESVKELKEELEMLKKAS